MIDLIRTALFRDDHYTSHSSAVIPTEFAPLNASTGRLANAQNLRR